MRTALLIVLLAFAGVCAAADRQLQIAPKKPAPGGEKRLALIIGNSAYKTAPLRNPANDARAIANTLASAGFSVNVVEDATYATMWRMIRAFGDELRGGGVGLFYYAGHGVQLRGKNYLLPVDADVQHEEEVEFQAIDANLVLARMDAAKNGLNLLILDACRNNPFARGFRSIGQGLAQMDAPAGTLVAFATAPGAVAADGDGENGVYTKHLLANMGSPGLPIEQLFKQVRIGVTRETSNRQVPWESSSLTGNFFFVPADPRVSEAQRKREIDSAVAAAVRVEQDKLATERVAMQQKMELTIRELLARQRVELEEETKRRGEKLAAATPPQPAPAATAPLQTASIATAPVAAAARDARFPQVGDSWQYRYVDGTTRLERMLRYEIAGVSSGGILESEAGTGAIGRAYDADLQLVFNNAWLELSPYLLAFSTPKPGQKWASVPVQGYKVCQLNSAQCRFEAEVIGTEKIVTAAGTFETTKIVVEGNGRFYGHTAGPMSWRRLTFWYSAEAKRVVKSTARTMAGVSYEPDYDVELISYKLN